MVFFWLDYIITKHAPRYLKGVSDRSKLKKIKANLGSIFGKFVKKTGNTPWSKIINNIRASWISDLLDGKYQTSGTRLLGFRLLQNGQEIPLK